MGQQGIAEEGQGAAMLGFFGFVMVALMLAYLANESAAGVEVSEESQPPSVEMKAEEQPDAAATRR